jgi:hypothetical protein
MPDTVTVYVPVSTWISVQAYTNAYLTQRITITAEDGTTTVLTGSGERNAPMAGGNYGFTSPATSKSPLGWAMVVKVESSDGSGGYQPSQVMQGSASVMYFTMSIVVSEDWVDNDWNDAVVQVTWWVPPSARDVRDLHRESGKER